MSHNLIDDPSALAALNAVPVLFFPDKSIKGAEREEDWSFPEVLLADILTQPWPAEICFTQYHHSKRTRINLGESLPDDLSFNLVALDIDTRPHLPISERNWTAATGLSAASRPVPNILYRTHRGVRCIYLIDPVSDALGFEARRQEFLRTACDSFAKDPCWKVDATRNWNAFFRAPRILYRNDRNEIVDLRSAPIWLWHTERIALPAVVPANAAPRAPHVQGSGRGIEAAVRWLATVPPAVEGDDGDRRTFWVLNELAWTFGLTDLAVLEAISGWNSRCDPPWSDAELLRKLVYVRRKGARDGR